MRRRRRKSIFNIEDLKRKFPKRRNSLNFRRRRNFIEELPLAYWGAFVGKIALAILLGFLFVEAFGIQGHTYGDSMEPTLSEKDTILLNRVSYILGKPKTNDIVVFVPRGNVSAKSSTKRVVAVPGDRVLISNGQLFVNGEKAKDVEEFESIQSAGIAGEEITLGNNEYFVLGDNRNNSEDSRFATIGLVHKEDIKGKAWFVLFGPHFGDIK